MAAKKDNKQNPIKPTTTSRTTSPATTQTATTTPLTSNKLVTWWIGLLLLLVITTVAFYPGLDNELNNWDDDRYVTDNTLLTDLSPQAIKDIFTTPVNAVYCPLVVLSFAIEKQIVGLNPFLYHFNNLLLHLICVGLVFWFMRLLKFRIEGAFLVALLFGIHTMRVESVTWVTERKDVLFGVFYLASICFYVLAAERPQQKIPYTILSILLFIPALFSKIQAVALPLSLLCIDYYRGTINSVGDMLKRGIEKTPYFLLSLAIGILGIYFLKQDNLIDVSNTFPAYYRPFFGTYTVAIYLLKFILPLPSTLAACYPYPATLSSLHYISPIVLLIIGFLLYTTRRYPIVLAGMAFFFFNVVFVIQIVGAGQAYLADRFTYIPYLGLFMILGWFFNHWLTTKKASGTILKGGAAFYLLLLFVFTFQRTNVWQNSETLWTDVISKYDNVDVAFNNRGNYYKDKKETDKALADFSQVLRIKPENHDVYTNRGNLYFNNNDFEKAFADYEKVISILEPKGSKRTKDETETLGKAYNNRGSCYFNKQNIDQAAKDYNRALELYPDYPDAFLNRGVYHAVTKQHEKAVADFSVYLESKKENPQVFNWRAISYNAIGKYAEAIEDETTALRQKESGEYLYHRGVAFNALGKSAEAQTDFAKAQSLGYNPPK